MISEKGIKIQFAGILFSLAAFALSVNGIFPLITKLSEEGAFPFSSFGTILFAQFSAFALMSFILPKLAVRLNHGTAAMVALGLGGLFFILVITPLVKSYLLLHAWAFCLGLSGGAVETGSSILITNFDNPGSSRMINLSQAVYCIGAIAAPQIIALLLSQNIQWKISFFVLSALIGIITLFFCFTNLRADKYTEHKSENDHGGLSVRELFMKKPLLFLLSASMFFYTGAECGYFCWTPSFFEKYHQITVARAALRLSLFWGGLIVGRFAAFFLASKLKTRVLLVFCTWAMTASALLFVLFTRTSADTLIILLIGLAAGPIWPCIVAVAREYGRSEKAASTVIGAGGIGVAVVPLISGWIIGRYGFSPLFILLVFMSGAMAVCLTVVYAAASRGINENS